MTLAHADYFKDEAKQDFQKMMADILANPPPELLQKLAKSVAAESQQLMVISQPQQQLQVVQQPLDVQSQPFPSSVGSTAAKDHYPVDDIDRPWACTLLLAYGTMGRTRKVATGLAIPGREFHGATIPDAFCRVEVQTVVPGQEDNMLDIPGPEGIETLGEAVNNFILWPRRHVMLIDPPPSPSPAAKAVAPSPGTASTAKAAPSPSKQIEEEGTGFASSDLGWTPPLHEQGPELEQGPEQEKQNEPATQSEPAQQTPPATQSEPAQQTPPATQSEPASTPPKAPSSKRKAKIPIMLTTEFDQTKLKQKWAGTAQFLTGLGAQKKSRIVELETTKKVDDVPDQERPAVASETAKPTSSEPKHPAVAVEATKIKPPAVITHSVKIKVPTKKDYQKVPDTYVPGRLY